ncbi:MAG TPA: T9SS type A sorting domain-containing protein, partial [Bacteroidales bacterium]
NTSLTAYPNPFHHSTNIEFSLEKTTWVQIDVYNVIGEKVDVIYQADLPAGTHTLNYQAADLANGIYFIKLQAGNTITTTKLLKN